MAGGFEVSDSGVFELDKELEEAFEKANTKEMDHAIVVDRKLAIDDIGWDLFNDISKLAPFGVGNAKPVFVFEGVTISSAEFFGKTGEHLKLIFKNSLGKTIQAIKFFAIEDEKLNKLKAGQSINLIANLEKSTFGRYPELRLRIIAVI